MKHTGSCTRDCGHRLSELITKANAETQRHLDRDPRVIEYRLMDESESEDNREWFHVTYAPNRAVSAMYRADATNLGIKGLC